MRYAPTVTFLILSILSVLAFAANSASAERKVPAVAGEIMKTQITGDETLMDVARREGFGYENVLKSNPGIDPWIPGEETVVTLPGEAILPYEAELGVMINLAELRLFHVYVTGDENVQVDIYPLGIGRAGRETPVGKYRIIVKKENPYWRVPVALREQDPTLPKVVPPGPKNPLGDFWIGLSAPGYGVHGTNRPFGVGRRVSYGCLRMYPEDIAKLFDRVQTGLPVQISYNPIKAAWHDNELLLEVHPDYLHKHEDAFQSALSVISKTGWPGEIDYAKVKEVVLTQRGQPFSVGKLVNN